MKEKQAAKKLFEEKAAEELKEEIALAAESMGVGREIEEENRQKERMRLVQVIFVSKTW